MKKNQEHEFRASRYIIVYKFVLGAFEFLLGVGVILLGKQATDIYESFKSAELLEDPHDLLINLLEKIIPYIFDHQSYIVIILLLLGAAKIIGSIGLMYRKHWGLDLLVILTTSLLPFQLYNLVLASSFSKLIYFVFNILIALYLVKFQPKAYFLDLEHRINKKRF